MNQGVKQDTEEDWQRMRRLYAYGNTFEVERRFPPKESVSEGKSCWKHQVAANLYRG